MTGDERRKALVNILSQSASPVSGLALGEQLQVSRQVIVQDIALLRASGFNVVSTNRGYVLRGSGQATRLVKVRHGRDRAGEEMNAIVDLGGCLLDVMVNHRTYGRISAPLDIRSRRDVKRFLAELEAGISSPLCELTNGYHFHNIAADGEDVLDEIQAELDRLGFLAEFTEFEREMF